MGRGLGCTQGETGRLSLRRPALVTALVREIGVQDAAGLYFHLDIEGQAGVGVLREIPPSSRASSAPRRLSTGADGQRKGRNQGGGRFRA